MTKSIALRSTSMLAFVAVLFMISCKNQSKEISYRLWYNQPAEEWTDALPVGNGRLGAMVFGNIGNERIQFNEESLWAGVHRNCNNPKSLEYLDEIQTLLLNDKNNEALELTQKYMMGIPPRIRSYQTFGDVWIDLAVDSTKISDYNRSLDLNSGIAKTSFEVDGQLVQREVFASAPGNIIVIHLSSGNKKVLNGNLAMTRQQDAVVIAADNETLVMEGQIMDPPDPQVGPGGAHMKFAAIAKVLDTDGTFSQKENSVSFEKASTITVVLTAATDYNMQMLNFDRKIDPLASCENILSRLSGKTYGDLKEDHETDHQAMFNRMSFELGNYNMDTIPTDVRLQNVMNGQTDDNLVALYFQYGRYLLMGSSRAPGILPANLQGVWNPYFHAPWNSDYHTNINVQMNYWPAEVCNLSETSLPYIHFFKAVSEPGTVTAKEMYGADGWTMHHGTNIFGRTAIQDAIKYGMFPMGASWVCFHIWRHFEYTQDTAYLENVAWPVLKEAAEFVVDFLIESPQGYYVTAPSYSPENAFYLPGSKEPMQLTYGPTMDIMIIRELFEYVLSAMDILGIDDILREEIMRKRDNLAPIQLSENGTIQEWINDYEEAEPGHRHISHLLALHPGTQITPDDQVLFDAARKTIEYRLSHGGGHTGWSRAWIINFYARLLDGEEAYKHVYLLLQKSTLRNLFDTHPPFQIDGNFGGTAGIAEMLLQSHGNVIHILPALPSGWSKGKITGLKARGNYTVDMEWELGVPVNVTLVARKAGPCVLRYKDSLVKLDCEAGKTYKLNEDFNF